MINKLLIKGSATLLIAFGVYNFFHFLFQFFMARMLSISDYGVLAVLFAILYLFSLFTESIQVVITKYTTNVKDNGELKSIYKASTKKALKISFILLIIFLVISVPLSLILKIDYGLMSLNGLMIFLAFLLPIGRGIIQGKGKFRALGINMIIESGSKLFIGIVLVYFGLRVYGAIAAVILGATLALVLSYETLKDIRKAEEKEFKTKGINKYALSAFLITTIIVIFYSIDVILARLFFSPEIAGSYAIASMLGKIIFWGTLPISKAMFPMSAENSLHKNRSDNVFANALGILSFSILSVLAMFYFFPELIIKIFSGKIIPESISILFYVGIAFSFISLTNLILLHKLSLGKVRGYFSLFIFIAIEIFLLSYFSKDLLQYSIAFITASAILLWGTIVLIKD